MESIGNVPNIHQKVLEKLCEKIKESETSQIGQLILSHESDNFSAQDLRTLVSLVGKKIVDYKSMNAEKACVESVLKIYPQYFATNTTNYELPKDLEEKRAVIKLLILCKPEALKSLKLSQYSLDDVLELLPKEKKIPYKEQEKYKNVFHEFGLIEHLNHQTSTEDFFKALDKILSQSKSTARCLTENISKINVDHLSIKEKILIYNKIENRLVKSLSFDKKNLPIKQVVNELKKIEDPIELASQLGELLSIAGNLAASCLISEIIKDPLFESTLGNLGFVDKMSLAQKICAYKMSDSALENQKTIINQLNFNRDLERSTSYSEYLQIFEKILSLGDLAIDSRFYSNLVEHQLENVTLNFEQKLELTCKMTGVSDEVFRNSIHARHLFQWVFKEEGEAIGEVFKNEGEEAAKNRVLSMHRELAKVENSEWIVRHLPVIDKPFSIEESIQLIEVWSGNGSRAISIINQQMLCREDMTKEFLKKLATVEPISLRMDHYKKLTSLLGDPFALLIIENFGLLNIREMKEEERHVLFLMLASQGPLAAIKLIPFLKTYVSDSEVKLLIYRQIASHGPTTFQELLKDHETFPEEVRSSFLEYVNYLARKGLFSSSNSVSKISSSRQRRQSDIELEILIWDPSVTTDNMVEKINPIFQPFLVKKAEEITEKEIEELSEFVRKISQNPGLEFLGDVFKNIRENKKKLAQFQLLKCFIYTLQQKAFEDIKIVKEILPLIFQYQDPSHRFLLVRQVHCIKKLYLESSKKEGLKPRSVEEFSRLLLSRCIELGLPENQAKQLYEKISNHSSKIFKDTKNCAVLLDFLFNVIGNAPFTKDEFLALSKVMGKILDNKNGKEVITELQMLNAIQGSFGREELLSCIENYDSQSAAQFFLQKFQKALHVNVEGDFAEAYPKTFGNFRHPHAIFVYLGSVNQLPIEEKRVVLKALKIYVEGVFSGEENFRNLRCSTENGRYPHLEKIFNEHPTIREVWLDKGKVESLSLGDSTVVEQDYKKFLYQRLVANKHVDHETYPSLIEYLNDNISFKEAYENLSEDTEINRFQLLAIQLCEKKIEVKKFIEQVTDLKCLLEEFKNTDLPALNQKKGAKGEYTISESDDPEDLLQIGTEVSGSCQRIDGTPSLNKCLVGYLLHGDVCPIVIKQDGRIVARSLLRLLWDETKQSPVLLQERIYANFQDPELKKAINAWALKRAKQMGIPLVAKEIEGTEKPSPYQGRVMFLGGPAPYIYSDAGRGVLDGDKPFDVTGCDVLYQP